MDYLKQLLNGQKDFFTLAQIRKVNVPRFRQLSLRTVLEDVESMPLVLKYLPDHLDGDEPPIDREFVFTIVNTCDSNYFPKQLRKIENERMVAAANVKEDIIEVRPEVLKVLEMYGASPFQMGSNPKANKRSLAALKKNSKKRLRPAGSDDEEPPKQGSGNANGPPGVKRMR